MRPSLSCVGHKVACLGCCHQLLFVRRIWSHKALLSDLLSELMKTFIGNPVHLTKNAPCEGSLFYCLVWVLTKLNLRDLLSGLLVDRYDSSKG